MLAIILTGVLLAHSFYSPECCGGKDCHPVPCSEILRDSHGDFAWRRGANDYVFFPKFRMKLSEDDGCHVCVIDSVSPSGICLYLAPGA